ncbi:WcaI family glycosyltransferase [Aquabacterium sp. A3]|uniref:WcaI family glycosyltransferase n=1 Tax=Aquabacterium sp. A3 TaxID=3132829 RepID=UPI00311A2F2A
MRILLLSAYFAPELVSIGKYNTEMAVWLQGRGHEVRVVCMPPHYPAWQVWPGYRAWRYAKDQQQGIDIWRCPTWIPRQPGGLRRLVSMGLFALSSLPVLIRQAAWRPDVVVVVEPPLFLMMPALVLKGLSGSTLWLHVQDLEVDAAFDLGLLQGQWMRRLALGVERWLMRRCHRVSTISSRMMDRLRAKGIDDERLFLFPNWVTSASPVTQAPAAPQPPATDHYRQLLGLQAGDQLVMYAGNMAAKQGLEVVVDVARLMQTHAHVHFLLVGDGPARQALQSRAHGLVRVHFLPLQPADMLMTLLASADVHLLPQRLAAADLVMPSKLAGMMASGKPVVACTRHDTEIATVLEGRGLIVPPEDAEALMAGIHRMLSSPAEAQAMGEAARVYVRQSLMQDAVLSQFEDALKQHTGH